MSVPNLPGQMPDKRSWLHRNAQGFKAASIGASDRSDERAAEAEQRGARSLAEIQRAGEAAPPPAVEIMSRLQKPVLFTEQPKSMKGLLSGGGVFAPLSSEAMRTNNMELGSGVPYEPPTVPNYVAQDKMVCRFFGYFLEQRSFASAVENPLGVPTTESRLVRRLTIHFYLDDGKVEMNEVKTDNSGVRGGTWFRKGPLKGAKGEAVVLADFHVGKQLEVLGQTIFVVDADKATRDYFRRVLQDPLAAAMTMPAGPPAGAEGAALATGLQSHTVAPDGAKTGLGACSMGYSDRKKQLDKEFQYLHGDARVLKFLAVLLKEEGGSMTMADQMLGDDIQYTLSYYMVDDTMDVKLIRTRRASRTDQGTLLKRGKIPKNWRDAGGGVGPNDGENMTHLDVRVNGTLEFFGRKIKILDCDAPTRAFYSDLGIPQPVRDSVKTGPAPVAPGEDDGFLAIGQPNVTSASIKRARVKAEASSGMVLKCDARLLKQPDRVFQLFFFLEDDSMQIYEQQIKNSGMNSAPNFLKRGKYEVQMGGEKIAAGAAVVELGARYVLNGYEWETTGVDENTFTLCASMPERFPAFDPRAVYAKLLALSMTDSIDVMAMFARYDVDNLGFIPAPLFSAAVDAEGIFECLSPQEALTAVRHITGADGNIYYPDMADLMAQLYFDADAEPSVTSTFEASSGPLMKALLSAGRAWRADLRRLPRTVKACVPLTDFQAALAASGVVASDQDLFTLRYLYGVDPTTNAACAQELLERSALDGTGGIEAARGSGSSAVRSRSLREVSAPKAKARALVAGSLDGPSAEIPVFISINALCNGLYKHPWLR